MLVPSLLTFGGGLAIGSAVAASGTSDWIVTRLGPLAELPTQLAIPLAGLIGTDPVELVILVAIVSSIDFALVIGTPPTMLAYDTGLFTTRRIFSIGIALDIIGVLLVGLVLGRIWALLGVV